MRHVHFTSLAPNDMGINEGCSSKSIVSCEDRNKLNRTTYGGSSQATFVLYLVMYLVVAVVLTINNRIRCLKVGKRLNNELQVYQRLAG